MGERIMNINKMAENVKELKSQESKNRQVHLLLVSLIKLLRREK